jgi:predicted ATP-dependent endonuclease of OLD family
MKIQRLKINSYRHLENLEFDFTYQSGDKKGQPLDKICLIGQSATGKTSILEFIKEVVCQFGPWGSHSDEGFEFLPESDKTMNGDIDFIHNGIKIRYHKNKMLSNNLINPEDVKFPDKLLLYFTAEITSPSNFQLLSQNPTNRNVNETNLQPTYQNGNSTIEQIKRRKFLIFNGNTEELIWEYILDDIQKYREKVTQKGNELINKGLHTDFQKMASEMEQWKHENPNPLESLAKKCLNPVLKKLNLELDLIDTSAFISLKPIATDKAVPTNALSTGTKQLLLNLLPLYKLNTKGSIVLNDEPERSLYPDVQIELMDHYQRLAPDAQLIVATHSPFIAAAFEPDERFILYFDDEGKVAVKKGSSPIGDDPNDILKSDFGLTHLMNEKGIDAYREYIRLKEEMASEKDATKKKELMLEAVALGDKYKF